MTPDNTDSREDKFRRAYDLVVIGGGFHGACAFEEAAARGVNVLLLERGDFCSGASANSMKTVHGGIRHLQSGDIRRLRLMARARQLWALRAPRLLRPLICIAPLPRSFLAFAPFVRIGALRGPKESEHDDGVRASRKHGVTTLVELRDKLTAKAETERFSGVVLIAKDGKPVFHEAFGYADYANKERNKRDTKFNLGSINKLFTMAAVYQLLKAGVIDLDDPIGKYLPQFPKPVRDTVTIRHLLDHRSGWGAYWDNPTWKARRHELRTLDGYMAFIKDIPLDFEPGTRQQYSNTGYEILGAIIEKASGQSYDDYISKNLYEPIGMKSTELLDRDLPTSNVAIGYQDGGYGTDNLSWLPVKGTAAGGGFSTAGDMLRFARAIDDATLLPSKFTGRVRGGGFAGGAPGVSTMFGLNIAGDHTIVVLSNFDPPSAMDVGREITEMLRRNNPGVAGTAKYRIGIGLAPGDDGPSVNHLVPGAPGERDGLRTNDVLLALNGALLNDDPLAMIDAALTKPDPIVLRVRRGQSELNITVTPEPIDGPSH